MRTDELIVQLAGSARPVQPLAPPLHRLGRWTAAAGVATLAGVALIGTRPDSGIVTRQTVFLGMAALTLTTALISAAAALVLSVPGAERSPVQRWAPIAAFATWAALLTLSIASGGSAVVRIVAFPFHVACLAEIIGLAVIPAWGLFIMLDRAAPLRLHWSAGLASLAALALAAVGTQFICPVDDPAHLLVGHLGPVVALAALGALFGTRVFKRRNRRLLQGRG